MINAKMTEMNATTTSAVPLGLEMSNSGTSPGGGGTKGVSFVMFMLPRYVRQNTVA